MAKKPALIPHQSEIETLDVNEDLERIWRDLKPVFRGKTNVSVLN